MERDLTYILAISILTSILIFFFLVLFIFRILKLYNKKQTEFLIGIQNLKFEKEKDILNTRIEVQEETFQIISREIHDNINQLLTLSKLNLNSIAHSENSEKNRKIENSILLITESINGLTNLSRSLNTDLIKDVGISNILKNEFIRLRSINPISIEYNFDNSVDFLTPEIQLLIFRITQESIRNAITHGKASYFKISLTLNVSNLEFEFVDDGVGFDKQKIIENKYSQGLKNIEKRVFLVNGKFEINSKNGEGTKLKITIPTTP